LVQSIAVQADGVSSGVSLVVKSLLQGLLNGDRVSDLEKRLSRSIPKTLEAFFQHVEHMLDSVDEEYVELMPKQLQYALDSADTQSLIMLWFLNESQEDPEYAFKETMKPLSNSSLIWKIA